MIGLLIISSLTTLTSLVLKCHTISVAQKALQHEVDPCKTINSRPNEQKRPNVYHKQNAVPPHFCSFLKHETQNMTQNYKYMLISIISEPVFGGVDLRLGIVDRCGSESMPRNANDLLGKVDVFVGIACQCLGDRL